MCVAISQRVEEIAGYNERRDSLDQQWHILLEKVGLVGLPVPNALGQPLKWLIANHIRGVILTGGNDLAYLSDARNPASERDNTEAVLLDFAIKNNLPVLGVCRGMQIINHFFGGTLKKIEGHVARRHRIYAKNNTFNDLIAPAELSQKVNSFHSSGITVENMSEHLISLLESEDGVIEALKHKRLPFYAIMWHPEREKPFKKTDMNLLKYIFKKGAL
jgi:putative glutamine amidotransferase